MLVNVAILLVGFCEFNFLNEIESKGIAVRIESVYMCKAHRTVLNTVVINMLT